MSPNISQLPRTIGVKFNQIKSKKTHNNPLEFFSTISVMDSCFIIYSCVETWRVYNIYYYSRRFFFIRIVRIYDWNYKYFFFAFSLRIIIKKPYKILLEYKIFDSFFVAWFTHWFPGFFFLVSSVFCLCSWVCNWSITPR